MGCGIFITRWPALLSTAFHVSASYMPSGTASVDPYLTSVQWSRRFLGLRLFLSLSTVGWEGYSRHVRQTLGLSALFRDRIGASGWMVVNDLPVGVLCMVPARQVPVRSIVSHVIASGRAWVSVAMFEDREVVRACVTGGLTTAEDVSMGVAALLRAEEAIHEEISL